MRGKEYMGAVTSTNQRLLLHTLFHEGELKNMEEAFDLPQVELKEKEVTLAKQIIENLTEEFAEDMLTDEHRQRLLAIVRQKVEGQESTVTAKKQPARVVDLMEALKRSLEVTAPKRSASRVDQTPVRTQAREEKRRRKHA